MAIADHVNPREQVRYALRDRLRELIDPAFTRIDVDAPLDPEHPGELDPGGEPAKLWQNVPVITARDLEAALSLVFGEPLPAPSEAAEVATPATIFVAAECPRCHVPGRIPLTVSVELHQDDSETLHLKGKSKPAIHLCGQMSLPEDAPEQTEFELEDIIGEQPTVPPDPCPFPGCRLPVDHSGAHNDLSDDASSGSGDDASPDGDDASPDGDDLLPA